MVRSGKPGRPRRSISESLPTRKAKTGLPVRQSGTILRLMSDQRILPLTAVERSDLEKRQAWVEGFLNEGHDVDLSRPTEILGLLDAILEVGVLNPDETFGLQSLGLMLGEALRKLSRTEWAMVEDEYGRDYALNVPGTSILIFPMTMISKRIEDGRAVDVFALVDFALRKIEEMIDEGY